MKARYYGIGLAMAALAAVAFAAAFPSLPESVPTHWNLHGEVDGHGSRWSLFFLGPVMMAGLLATFAALPWLSPRRFAVDEFERTCLNIMLIVEGLLGYIFAVALWSALNGAVDMPLAIMVGLSLLAIFLGNILGKVRRNFFIGIRTPWTLASERVWHATHRLGGRLLVIAGFVSLAGIFVDAPAWAGIALVSAAFIAPVAYSLFLYKRLERSHELDAGA
jgi:uncharacterized membrane protein